MSKEQIEANCFYRSNITTIRSVLWGRDRGICAKCRKKCSWDEWEADHIKEVRFGGSPCPIENFQTLCIKCHYKKTSESTTGTKDAASRQQMHIPVSVKLHQKIRVLAAKQDKTIQQVITSLLEIGWHYYKNRKKI